MTRIAVRAYSRIEATTNRWCSTVLRTHQFCSTVPCSGSRVSGLADRQSQNPSVRFVCKIIFKVIRDWQSANPLTHDPLHGTIEQNWRVRKTVEHQRLVEASIRDTRVQQYASWDGTLIRSLLRQHGSEFRIFPRF